MSAEIETHALIINAEMDAEFADFYRNVHVPEVVAAVDGYGPAVHYEMASFQPSTSPPGLRRYLTVIEIHGDPEEVFGKVAALRASGAFSQVPASGRPYQTAVLFRAAQIS